jgi:hypothetical protein
MDNVLKADPAVMRLAHPLRCLASQHGVYAILEKFLGTDIYRNLQDGFRREGLTSEIVMEVLANPANRKLSLLLEASSRADGGTEVGNAMSMLLFLRHAMHPQPYFVIDDALVEMMENTDIADDVTVSMVNVPYSRFYIEFGKSRNCHLHIPNVATGRHVLEGAYVERGHNKALGEGLFVLLTASPLGKSNEMDDATHSLFIPLSDPSWTVRQALEHTAELSTDLAIKSGYRQTPSEFVQPTFEAVMFLLKTLLYINLPEARKEVRKEKSEWLKSVSSLQSTAKKAKAAKRGRSLVDHIRISAPPVIEGKSASAGPTRGLKQHWRRGHYRSQAHGPQFSLRKVIFVQPVLVHGDASGTATPQYIVS